MRAGLLVAVTTVLLAQEPPDPTELLAEVRESVVARAKRLPDYVCVQKVNRQYFKYPQPRFALHSCAQITAFSKENPLDLVLQSTDRLRLELKVSQGTEIGTWAGASQFSSRSVFDLIGGGAYGTGILGNFLTDIFQNDGPTYKYVGEETAGGIKLTSYSYRVPRLSSHYLIKTGSDWTQTGFDGVFSIDSNSLDLRRLVVDANEMPPETGACEVVTTVDYQRVKVGAGEFLLPIRSSMRMVAMDATESQTSAIYSGCREYHGEATIRFDDGEAPGDVQGAADPRAPLPAGLSLSLALTSPIDTDTAADIVTARLRGPVRLSKEVLAPAGATVVGRIVQMRHWIEKPPHFTISLMLEKLEVGGVATPLYARRQPVGESTSIVLPPLGQSRLVAAFVFPANQSRYIVPAGYQMNWVTVSPPP